MWLCFKLRDGRTGVCHESDIKSAAAMPGIAYAKMIFRDGVEDEIEDVAAWDNIGDALAHMLLARHGEPRPRTCRVCSCTDDDCRQCVEKTGLPCSWVEDDLCSACLPSQVTPDAPATAYARVLETKRCPHCDAHIGDYIFQCPDCGRPLDEQPETPAAKLAREMREGTAVFVSPPKAGLFIFEVRPREWRVGHRYETGDSTYLDDDPAKASPDLRFRDWPQSLWLNFPTREAAQKAVDDAGLRLADDPRSPAEFDPMASAKALLNKPKPDDAGDDRHSDEAAGINYKAGEY